MMYWAVGIICYAYAQMAMYGHLSTSMAVGFVLVWFKSDWIGSILIYFDLFGFVVKSFFFFFLFFQERYWLIISIFFVFGPCIP